MVAATERASAVDVFEGGAARHTRGCLGVLYFFHKQTLGQATLGEDC